MPNKKVNSLADKMNSLSKKLDLSEELLSNSDDIIEYVEKSPALIDDEVLDYGDIMNLQSMVDDFKYIRATLNEITTNAKRVQGVITISLLEGDGEDQSNQANLILSFSELSKAITDAMKLYILSYKEMSTTLLNLDKIEKNEKEKPNVVNNTINNYGEALNTADLIKKLNNGTNNE